MSGIDFASGRYARGVCDMCGFTFMLHELKREIYNQKPTGFLVCEDCWDEDNPQLQLGRWPINDPQAIRDARPVGRLAEERNLFGFNPVGNPATSVICQTGIITVNSVATNPRLDIVGTL